MTPTVRSEGCEVRQNGGIEAEDDHHGLGRKSPAGLPELESQPVAGIGNVDTGQNFAEIEGSQPAFRPWMLTRLPNFDDCSFIHRNLNFDVADSYDHEKEIRTVRKKQRLVTLEILMASDKKALGRAKEDCEECGKMLDQVKSERKEVKEQLEEATRLFKEEYAKIDDERCKAIEAIEAKYKQQWDEISAREDKQAEESQEKSIELSAKQQAYEDKKLEIIGDVSNLESILERKVREYEETMRALLVLAPPTNDQCEGASTESTSSATTTADPEISTHSFVQNQTNSPPTSTVQAGLSDAQHGNLEKSLWPSGLELSTRQLFVATMTKDDKENHPGAANSLAHHNKSFDNACQQQAAIQPRQPFVTTGTGNDKEYLQVPHKSIATQSGEALQGTVSQEQQRPYISLLHGVSNGASSALIPRNTKNPPVVEENNTGCKRIYDSCEDGNDEASILGSNPKRQRIANEPFSLQISSPSAGLMIIDPSLGRSDTKAGRDKAKRVHLEKKLHKVGKKILTCMSEAECLKWSKAQKERVVSKETNNANELEETNYKDKQALKEINSRHESLCRQLIEQAIQKIMEKCKADRLKEASPLEVKICSNEYTLGNVRDKISDAEETLEELDEKEMELGNRLFKYRLEETMLRKELLGRTD